MSYGRRKSNYNRRKYVSPKSSKRNRRSRGSRPRVDDDDRDAIFLAVVVAILSLAAVVIVRKIWLSNWTPRAKTMTTLVVFVTYAVGIYIAATSIF